MENSQRYFIELSYNGTNYHGWQTQPNAITVQETLDKALSIFFRQKVETLGCGRTDAGVHASQFFAHLDLEAQVSKVDDLNSVGSLNSLLPHDIAIKRFVKVPENAHARFDASSRSYIYKIHYCKDPFKNQFSWLIRDRLNIEEMNKAAFFLHEYTDFSCFSKSNTQVFTNNCKITYAFWEEVTDGLIFQISADRFLRNMVRAIVGTMMDIGKGKISAYSIHDIIESKNRSKAGTSVPACGLYLTEVKYPYI